MIILSPYPKLQFIDNNGVPMAGCLLFTYAAGTNSPMATYADQTGLTYNQNPIILDAGGRCDIWLDSNFSYKYKLLNADGTILFIIDNINNLTTNTVTSVLTIADLIAIDTTQLQAATYNVLGYAMANDGGGGTFFFIAGSTQTADDGMVFEPVTGPGRWFRATGADSEINIRWFGATGSGSEDAEPFLQAANDAASLSGWGVFLPAGTYTLNTNPTLTVPVRMAVGAQLSWATFTLTIEPTFSVNDYTQHFITTGGIDFGEKIINVYPEWFGAVGDGSMANNSPGTDDTTALQAAIDSCSSGMRVILNSSKKYWSGRLFLKPGVAVIGSCSEAHTDVGDFVSNLAFYSSGTSFLDLTNSGVGGLRGVTVQDLIIDGIGKNATLGIFLQTIGSIIKNCTIRNCITAIGFDGTATDNRVIGNALVDCTAGIGAGQAGTGNIISGNTFVRCDTDVYLVGAEAGWTVSDNCYSASPVPGPVAHILGVTDINNVTLSTSDLASVELSRVGGVVGITGVQGGQTGIQGLTGMTDNVMMWNRKHTVTVAGAPRLHSSLGFDSLAITPRVNTRAWYEKDVNGGHHWGDLDQEYMTLDGSGVLSFPSTATIATFKCSTDYVQTAVTTASTLMYQGKFVTIAIDGFSGLTVGSKFKLSMNGSITTLTDYGPLNPTVSVTPVGSTNTCTIPAGYGFVAGQNLTIMMNEFFASPGGGTPSCEDYQMTVEVTSYTGTTLAFTVLAATGIGAVLQKPQVLIQLPFVPANQATVYPCVVLTDSVPGGAGATNAVPGFARFTNSLIVFAIARTGATWPMYHYLGWSGTNKGFLGLTTTINIV